MSNADFFKILFNEGEQTCLADSIKSTRVSAIDPDATAYNWFCLNPLNPSADNAPTETWHRADRPRRADCNVTAYRSILVEMDKIPLAEQQQLVRKLDMPFSTCVFSGGKSYHYIISLDVPCATLDEYKKLQKRVYRALGGKNVVDVANGNPSRLTRFPNAFRPDKNQPQSLIEVRGRVSRDALETWLIANGAPDVPAPTHVARLDMPTLNGLTLAIKRPPSGFTQLFLANGAPEGEWNASLFRATCDLVRCGYDTDEVLERLTGITGQLDSSDMSTIRSAIRSATPS